MFTLSRYPSPIFPILWMNDERSGWKLPPHLGLHVWPVDHEKMCRQQDIWSYMQTISNIHPAQCVTRQLKFSCDDCERVFQVLPYLSTHTLKHTTHVVMKTTCPTTKVCQLYGNCGSNNTVVLQSYISWLFIFIGKPGKGCFLVRRFPLFL